MLDADRCWNTLCRREAAPWVYAVTTTGVYCKPTCPSRRPLRTNVRFYDSPSDAERAGFRACLRCGMPPDDRIDELCRYIEQHCDERITLADLSVHAGLSSFHLQRRFKAAVGVSPREYLQTCRMRKLKSHLRNGESVTAAIYDAGFGSGSRVYSQSDAALGMTPGEYSSGARDVSISYVTVASIAGLLMIGATDRGLCFVQFGDSRDDLLDALRAEYPHAKLQPMPAPYPAPFDQWMDALHQFLDGRIAKCDVPLNVRATAFQAQVWSYLQSVPRGEVRSYSEVAAGIGRPSAVRAVARACATNPVALLIPCHRVIRGNGDLGGYRWGIDRKRALLDREQSTIAAWSDSKPNSIPGNRSDRTPRKLSKT